MSSPYNSTTEAIVNDFVPTTPSPSNPHSVIHSDESSPAISQQTHSQQTYLSPHSVISSSFTDATALTPVSSSTRSPQSILTVPDYPDSKTPVIYDASKNNSNVPFAGSTAVWSQATSATYYPPPPPQYADSGQLYANAPHQQQQLQQQQQQQRQQYQHQQYQQQEFQQPYDLAPSFPLYPMGSTNAAATPHNNSDPDHLKPPTPTTAHMEIITGVGHTKDSKSRKKKMKKCWCFFIIFSIVLALVLGVLFGVILKKNNDGAGGQGSGGGASHTSPPSGGSTATYPGTPTPTGVPDIAGCVTTCQNVFTACTQTCGANSNSNCQSGCFSALTDCFVGCARF